MIADPIMVMERLDELSRELDRLSKELGETERELVPVEEAYEKALDVFECGCWDRHVKDDAKLPSGEMRLRLARREMNTKLLGQHASLLAKRKRLEKRIGSVKSLVEAQRSILSALKLEAEAAGTGLRRAA